MPTPNPGTRREHRGNATTAVLTTGITAADSSFGVSINSGWPTGSVGPFFVVVDPGRPNEEKILCSAQVAGVCSVAGSGRGVDGTIATTHDAGAVVYPVWTATEADELNEHAAATSGVHGATGAVVGTTDVQTLTNKSISGAANTITAIPSAAVSGLDTHLAATAAHGATGAVVGTTNTQVLTNKTIDGALNTLSNIPASALVGGPAGALVGTTDTQTLTNKTIDGGSNTLQNIPQTAVTGLSGHTHPSYSLTTHNHDADYSAAAHNHSGLYSPLGHTHSYAAVNHDHDDRYALYTTGDTYGKIAVRHVQWTNGTGRVHGETVSGGGTYYAVWVDGSGLFARNTSSIRFKENVRDHDVDPGSVLALRPRFYERKEGGTEYGLIAEEVHETLPEIVVFDLEGRIDGLRYDLLAVALLDVVKDQQERIEALETTLLQDGG